MLTPFHLFLVALYLFFFGCIGGWCLELLFRRFFSKANPERQWLNPGFLIGPYLPLYGFGTVILFVMSAWKTPLGAAIGNPWLVNLVWFLIVTLAMTLLEYIAGLIFIKGLKVKLWDYSQMKGNIQGLICPLFSLFWGILAILYDILLFPPLEHLVRWFIQHPLSSFTVGVISGVFAIDCAYSLQLGTVLRKKAKQLDTVVDLQRFQLENRKTGRFFTIPKLRSLTERLDQMDNFIHRSPASLEKES